MPSEELKSAASVVVVDYLGLTVEEVTNLRKELRDNGVQMKVVKNTILRRAAAHRRLGCPLCRPNRYRVQRIRSCSASESYRTEFAKQSWCLKPYEGKAALSRRRERLLQFFQ